MKSSPRNLLTQEGTELEEIMVQDYEGIISSASERIDIVGMCNDVPFTEERSEVFGGEGICAGERSVCHTG